MWTAVVFAGLALTVACASGGPVVVVPPGGGLPSPRTLSEVPPGHYPPPGECRLWFVDRPAGQQPPPAPCDSLVGRVPRGAFVLYNAQAWDADYDWGERARREPGSVPEIILRVLISGRSQ
jgi:hypothetical protein